MVVIYRQEILADISLFTSQPKANFYQKLFDNLDLSPIPEKSHKTGRKSYGTHNLIRAFIVMKCEGFTQITDLHDYLSNNLIIAYYCGFNIFKTLPSYSVFEKFIKNLDNELLQKLMQFLVLQSAALGLIDTSFIALDSTSIKANTSHNNPKSFNLKKFSKDNQPKSDSDCRLGVHTASNQQNEKNYEFYWGYKQHILVDCISGLPICELTTGANVADSTVTLQILAKTNAFLPLHECTFIADKGYDVKAIYNTICDLYSGECFIPINPRGKKDLSLLSCGNPKCDAGLAMNKDGKHHDKKRGMLKQKFCCPFKVSNDENSCPCNHPKYARSTGKKSRGCVKRMVVPLPEDINRLKLDRKSNEFKSTYALRTEVERYNSRFKQTGCERVFVRNQNSVANISTLVHISMLAIAITATITKSKVSYRSIKSVKRIA